MSRRTIAAIATGMTNSGIGIIRVSGSDAIEIVNRIFSGKDLTKVDSHTVHYGHILKYIGSTKKMDSELEGTNPNLSGIDSNMDLPDTIDEVMVLVMKGPRTYTVEDTVEIDCHGGITVLRDVLKEVLKAGAVLAEPGEFTKRAFLNGRIDLTQAESVMNVISAENDRALKNSMNQLSGKLSSKIRDIREKILYEIAYIESALDDPEHISLDGYSDGLLGKTDGFSNEIQHLLDTYDNGRFLMSGINTAIIGKPNAGKSSLLNLLSGRDRAIVTDIPGTTRDTLEEKVNLSGITLNVIDTAGIRKTDDLVEKIGVSKAYESMDKADLILYVVDSLLELDENDFEIIEKLKFCVNQGKKAIILFNKSDLVDTGEKTEKSNTAVDSDTFLSKFSDLENVEMIHFSTKTEEGLDQLNDLICNMFLSGSLNMNEDIYITSERHRGLLTKALDSLGLVRDSILNGLSEDFYSIDLMDAYTSLGEIIGEEVTDDLVDKIFREFCMGK